MQFTGEIRVIYISAELALLNPSLPIDQIQPFVDSIKPQYIPVTGAYFTSSFQIEPGKFSNVKPNRPTFPYRDVRAITDIDAKFPAKDPENLRLLWAFSEDILYATIAVGTYKPFRERLSRETKIYSEEKKHTRPNGLISILPTAVLQSGVLSEAFPGFSGLHMQYDTDRMFFVSKAN